MTDDSPHEVTSTSFDSTNVAEVEAYFGRTYTGLSIEVPGGDADFPCRHDAVGTGGMALSRLRMPVSWNADVDEMPDQIVVDHVRRGGLTLSGPGYDEVTVGPGGIVLVPPSGDFDVRCDHIDIDIVSIDAFQVADHAEQVSGIYPDAFTITGIRPVSPGFARYWAGTVGRVRRDIFENPFSAQSAIIRASARRSLAAGVLTTFPNTALDRIADIGAPRGEVSEATLRDVVDYLEVFAREPVGPADVADRAGLPAREIVAGLRRRRGVHPARLLWDARLRGARKVLADADADVTTVQEIAARWGFARERLFRIAYSREFGETPDRTLRR